MSSSSSSDENRSRSSASIKKKESMGTSPALRGLLNVFRLGRSCVTAQEVQNYVNQGYLSPEDPTSFRAPRDEEIL